MSQRNVEICQQQPTAICKPRWLIKRKSEPSCLYALYADDATLARKTCDIRVKTKARPALYRTNFNNTWVFSSPTALTLHVQCPHEQAKHLENPTIKLKKYGIIPLPQSCHIWSEDFEILPQVAIYKNVTTPGHTPDFIWPTIELYNSTEININNDETYDTFLAAVDHVQNTMSSVTFGADLGKILKELQESKILYEQSLGLIARSRKHLMESPLAHFLHVIITMVISVTVLIFLCGL